MMPASQAKAFASCVLIRLVLTRRATAMAFISSSISAIAVARVASAGARMSIENCAWPGMTVLATRPLFDREHHLGRRGKRVATQVHRSRACMASDAVHANLEARCAVDRSDDAKRQPLRLEARTLLDMR